MGKWTNEQLAQVVINPAMPMEVRMTAAWLDGRDEEVLGRDDAQGERPAGDASCFG